MFETLRKNKETIVLSVLFVCIVILGWYLWKQGDQDSIDDDIRVGVPLQTAQDTSYDWGSIGFTTTIGDTDTMTLPIYKVVPIKVDDMVSIVADLGFSGTGSNEGGGVYRFWGNDSEYARYDLQTNTLNVESPGIRLSRIDRGTSMSSGMETYVEEFITTYLGIESPVSLSVSKSQDGYMVNGYWRVGMYDVVQAHGKEYSLIAEFSMSGDLCALSLDGTTFKDTGRTVDVISRTVLERYVSLDTYPKEAYIHTLVTSDSTCEEDESCDPYALYTFDGFTKATIHTASIVYYYDSLEGLSEIVPVYRLEGSGTATDDDGRVHDVTVTIFANAVDPSQILLPPNR